MEAHRRGQKNDGNKNHYRPPAMTGERISDVQRCADMTIEIFQMQNQKEEKNRNSTQGTMEQLKQCLKDQ